MYDNTWKKKTVHGSLTITRSTLKKTALDLALMTGGAAAMYGIGRLLGEGMDHTPYIKEWVPQAVQYLSGMEVKGNIDGLLGVMLGTYGFFRSGITADEKTGKLKEISLQPATFTVKNE